MQKKPEVGWTASPSRWLAFPGQHFRARSRLGIGETVGPWFRRVQRCVPSAENCAGHLGMTQEQLRCVPTRVEGEGGWGRAQRAPRSRGWGLDARSSRLDPRHPNAKVVLESSLSRCFPLVGRPHGCRGLERLARFPPRSQMFRRIPRRRIHCRSGPFQPGVTRTRRHPCHRLGR